MSLEGIVIDVSLGPHRILEVVLRDELPWRLHEHRKDVEGAPGDTDFDAAHAQLVKGKIDLALPTIVNCAIMLGVQDPPPCDLYQVSSETDWRQASFHAVFFQGDRAMTGACGSEPDEAQ
jgi:hypothetical protein